MFKHVAHNDQGRPEGALGVGGVARCAELPGLVGGMFMPAPALINQDDGSVPWMVMAAPPPHTNDQFVGVRCGAVGEECPTWSSK